MTEPLWVCEWCGKVNLDKKKFCPTCGHRREWSKGD